MEQDSRASSCPEIRTVDRGARRRAVWAIVALSCVFLAGLILLEPYLSLDPDPAAIEAQIERVSLVFRLMLAGITFLTLACVVWMFRFAAQVRRADCYPPPGTQVIRDVRVLRGAEAIRRARALTLIAVLLLVIVCVFGAVSWLTLQALEQGRSF